MEKLLTSHQAAKLLNVWPHTLRRWEKEGKLKPLHTPGGHRRYKESQIMALIGEEITEHGSKRCAVYARVSTAKQAEVGNLQQEELEEDMIAIVTSFSARIYGKRGGRVAKKLTEFIEQEVTADENDS
ncbi:MAG: IS607 family transposase [Bacillota bacterium]